MSAAIIAFGAISAMGHGVEAVSVGLPGESARLCIRRDEELIAAGLVRPNVARVALSGAALAADGDRATALLKVAVLGCAAELDRALPSWRTLRIGLALGTSSGGMRTAEALFASHLLPRVEGEDATPREQCVGALYFAPMLEVVSALGVPFEPATLIMGACAASTIAIGVGTRWLAEDVCDLVIAGGFDAVSTLVATGFEVLRATTAELPPRPFRTARDGMALGEGAAVVALRPTRLSPTASVYVAGFGVTSDAIHLTAPDRSGRGLATAARSALEESGLTRVDLISPHGSATPFSDAAEARAIATVLPGIASQVVVHPFKAQIGHTLGASGVLETLACVDALTRGVYPASAGAGEIDPDASAHLLAAAQAGELHSALKLSAAFGGLNAALVLTRDAPVRPTVSHHLPVYLRAAVQVAALPSTAELAERIGWPIERVVRADALTRWTLTAVADLIARDGPLGGAGIIVGSAFATLETDASFFARIHERGTRMAEPRKFPYTSPNASAGDAGVAFGLTGPSFAVGSGLHAGLEAIVVAANLVRAGDADTIVVAAVDDVGPTVVRLAATLGIDAAAISSGAVALVLSSDPAFAVAKVGSTLCGMGPRATRRARASSASCGHRALLPLVGAPLSLPFVLEAASPDLRVPASASREHRDTVAYARVELVPLDPGIDVGAVAP